MNSAELYPWRCSHCQRINKKVATQCVLCHAHWTSGVKHNTEPKQQMYKATAYRDAWPTEQSTDWKQWEAWEQTDHSWSWQAPVERLQSRSQSRSQGSQSPRGRKGKGSGKNKNKGKSKTKDAAQGKAGAEAKGLSNSPFAPLAQDMSSWPSFDGSTQSSTPFAISASNSNAMESLAQKKECVAALRAAYPEGATIPQDTKDLMDKLDKEIDKLEKEKGKFVTKNIHSATKSLGKAQKILTETLEAKKDHRTRWIKHVTEAVTTWQGQLKEYQKQQATFQEIVSKAKTDIENAKQAIQTLSSTASQAQLAAMPPIASVTELDESCTEVDKEEEKLQGQLQAALEGCAAVLNPEIPSPAEEVEDLDMDEAEREKKRPRSMQPFGGSGLQAAGKE